MRIINFKSLNLATLAFTISFFSDIALANDSQNLLDRSMATRIESIERSLSALQKYTYNLSTTTVANQSNTAHATNTDVNIDEITEHLKNIHNDMEKLQQDITRINDRILQMSSNFEHRLSNIEDPIKEEKAAKKVVSNVESELEEVYYTNSTSSPTSSNDTNTIVANSIEDEFRVAYGYLKSKNYKQAQDTFERFIQKHPDSTIIGAARYWLGEIYSSNQTFDRAAVEYLKGYQSNPLGNRAADNLLRLGETLIKLDKRQEACATFMKMSKEFPKLHPSLKRRVDKVMQAISCKP